VLTEDHVVSAVAKHLVSVGYEIKSALTSLERGIDIVATHRKTGKQLLVEAKGGTSSKATTARFGKPFDRGQAVSHVSRALFYATQLREKYQANGTEVAVAFPDDKNHKALIVGVGSALVDLKIRVFFVNAEHVVSEYAPTTCRPIGLTSRRLR